MSYFVGVVLCQSYYGVSFRDLGTRVINSDKNEVPMAMEKAVELPQESSDGSS